MSDVWSAPSAEPKIEPGSATTLEAAFRNAQLLWSKAGSTFAAAYVGPGLAQVLVQIPTAVCGWQIAVHPNDPAELAKWGLASLAWTVVSVPVNVVTATVVVGFGRVARKWLVEGADSVQGVGAVYKEAASRFFPILGMLVVVGLITVAGFCMLVVPGVVAAFLLSMTAYLVATDTPFGEAFSRSYALVTRNWQVMGVYVVGMFLYMLVMMGAFFGLKFALHSAIGPFGEHVVAQVAFGVVAAILGFPLGLAANGLFVAIETADSGVAVRED